MIDTEHYGLHKPDENDYYNQNNENENMDAIDAALHGLETGKETPEGAQEKADQAKAEAISACRPVVVKTSGTGSVFTATIDGVTELTAGMLITIIPHTYSATPTPSLNVNGLGAKGIRRRHSYTNNGTAIGYSSMWLTSEVPQLLQYDGTYWIAIGNSKTYGPDIEGAVKVENGGTGKSSWKPNGLIYPLDETTLTQAAIPSTNGSFLQQGTSGAPYWTPPENMCDAIGALPRTGGQVDGSLRIVAPSLYPQISLQSNDDTETRLGVMEHNLNTKSVYLYNKALDGTTWSRIELFDEDTDLAGIVELIVQKSSGRGIYRLYGTHNVTVVDSTPTEFIGENVIAFCTSNHSIYRGINGANVRFY